MLVKLKLIGNRKQFLQTGNYLIGSIKEMHPDILDVTVYTDDGRKKLFHLKRPHQKYYEKYEYKPLKCEPEVEERTPDVSAEKTEKKLED